MNTLRKHSSSGNTEKYDSPSKYGYGIRHIQVVIFYLCIINLQIIAAHMGVTIVAMTSSNEENTLYYNKTISNWSNTWQNNNNNITEYGPEYVKQSNVSSLKDTSYERTQNTFNWAKSTQETVLGSFFLGHAIMMFPMGMVCQRWGGKIPMQIALFISGTVSIITPWLTLWGGWKAICFCRILQGLILAAINPSIHTLLAKWVPACERAKMTSFVFSGLPIGNVIAFQVGGILGDSRWGWPATFWSVGIINLMTFTILTVFVSTTPMEHTKIKGEEKEYILKTVEFGHVQKPKVPWKAIATSRPIWGIMAAHVGNVFSFVFIFTQVPSYIHYILGIDVKNSGLLSSLPYISAIISSVLCGWLSDFAINNNLIAIRNVRRICNSISSCGIALSILCVSFTKNMTSTVICFVIASSSDACANCGFAVNYIDIAPNFSGLLMGIGGALANIVLIVLPIIVSLIVIDMTNLIQWRIMFLIIAGVNLVNNGIFCLLMSAEKQSWNNVNNIRTATRNIKKHTRQESDETKEILRPS